MIEIDPEMATVVVGQTQNFRCTVTVETANSLTIDGNAAASDWSVDEGDAGGTLAPDSFGSVNMVYQAPVGPGLFHVTCAAHADPSAKATATVMVVAP